MISQLNRFNENYEKKIFLDVLAKVMPGETEEEEEIVREDDLSIFF